jgi:hypothetical protein
MTEEAIQVHLQKRLRTTVAKVRNIPTGFWTTNSKVIRKEIQPDIKLLKLS